MNRDEIVELAAGYALGTLETEERGQFEALLASGDTEARAALREFEAALVGLAAERSAPPPPAVKAALMARIDAGDRSRATVIQMPPPRSTSKRQSLWTVVAAGAIAAGIAAIAVGLAVSTVYDRRIERLALEEAQLKQELARQESLVTMLRDPATQIVALSGLPAAPEARGRMLWHATAGGLLVAQGLPPAPEGKAYELWAIAGKGAPVPAGVFTVDAKGVGSLRVSPLRAGEGAGGPRPIFRVTLRPLPCYDVSSGRRDP